MNEGVCSDKKGRECYCFVISVALLFVIIHNVSLGFISEKGFGILEVINVISKIGFSILLMAVGAIMLSDDRWLSVREVYKKPLFSILIPTAFWSVIGTVLVLILYDNSLTVAAKSLLQAYSKPVMGYLWFTYCFIAFCVLLPIVRLFTKKADSSLIFYTVIIWVITGVILPFLSSVSPYFTITNDAQINIYYGYIGFFLLGYYLKNAEIKLHWSILAIGFVLCCGLNIFLINHFIAYDFELSEALRQIYSPLNTAAAFCGLLFLIKVYKKVKALKKLDTVVLSISSMSAGIYFAHVPIFLILQKLFKSGAVSFILCLFITLAVSYVFVFFIRKIKFLSVLMAGKDI